MTGENSNHEISTEANNRVFEVFPDDVLSPDLERRRLAEIELLEAIYRLPSVGGGGGGFPPIVEYPKVAELPPDPDEPRHHSWKSVARFMLSQTFLIVTMRGFMPRSAPLHMTNFPDQKAEPNKLIAGTIPDRPRSWLGFNTEGKPKSDRNFTSY